MPEEPLYSTIGISPLELKLDIRNPRFLSMQPTQENAIIYLLTYAKVRELVQNIINVGGLFPGERIVVFKNEQNEYIVLEGNRRVCACQLSLDPSLIPISLRTNFPEIPNNVLSSINQVNVDVITTREAADSFLTSRHIGGVERWDPLAKMKFFEEKYANGHSLSSIASSTNYPINDIKDDITKYYLFQEGYALDCWTQDQKNNELNLFRIEADKFIRIFGTRGAKKALGLSFNPSTLRPQSTLPISVFKKILQRIMYCAYITRNPEEKIDTRTKNWRDVSGIEAILAQANSSTAASTQTENQQAQDQALTSTDTNSVQQDALPINPEQVFEQEQQPAPAQQPEQTQQPTPAQQPEQTQQPAPAQQPEQEQQSAPAQQPEQEQQPAPAQQPEQTQQPTPAQQPEQTQQPTPAQQPEQMQQTTGSNSNTNVPQNPSPQLIFFESLTWSGVNPSLPETQGLITIAEEIKRISSGSRPYYKNIPVCTTILLRSLVEQTLKYHLRKVDPHGLQNLSRRYDPSLNSLLKHYTDNQSYTRFIQDPNMQRLFSSLFGTQGLKDFLDLTVHQPHYVRPSEQHLESHARAGLFSFINYILNIP